MLFPRQLSGTQFLYLVKIIISLYFYTQIHVTGGWYNTPGTYDEIVQYYPEADRWEIVGKLLTARQWHAVGLVEVENITDLCA